MLSLPGALKRVIYSGTYSKPFATGIRVGFGISPAPLARALEHIKGNQDFGTSELLQAILERALESRLYAKHLKLIQARYAQKAGRMVDAMKKYFPSTVQWAAPQGGLYVWTKVPEPVDTGPRGELFETSLKQQVLYVPGCYAYAPDVMGPERNTAMRLSFGNASLHLIEEGIRRLGKSLSATLG
jgi:2-aminoadipate transaminase